jgi:hypothetical protein
MNTRFFVSSSSLILAGWLGATFFNEVPVKRYPKLDSKVTTMNHPTAERKGNLVLATQVRSITPTVPRSH